MTCKCDGTGWVYVPVKLGGRLSIERVACNCKTGIKAAKAEAAGSDGSQTSEGQA